MYFWQLWRGNSFKLVQKGYFWNEYLKPLNYVKVSYLRHSCSYFSGIMAILNLEVSYHLICKTNIFLWLQIFAILLKVKKESAK